MTQSKGVTSRGLDAMVLAAKGMSRYHCDLDLPVLQMIAPNGSGALHQKGALG